MLDEAKKLKAGADAGEGLAGDARRNGFRPGFPLIPKKRERLNDHSRHARFVMIVCGHWAIQLLSTWGLSPTGEPPLDLQICT